MFGSIWPMASYDFDLSSRRHLVDQAIPRKKPRLIGEAGGAVEQIASCPLIWRPGRR